MHSLETGARRIADALGDDALESGRFYASRAWVLVGDLVDQAGSTRASRIRWFRILIARIEAVRDMIPRVVGALSDAQLAAVHPELVNGESTSTIKLLVHLAGHLNYHLGQVD